MCSPPAPGSRAAHGQPPEVSRSNAGWYFQAASALLCCNAWGKIVGPAQLVVQVVHIDLVRVSVQQLAGVFAVSARSVRSLYQADICSHG